MFQNIKIYIYRKAYRIIIDQEVKHIKKERIYRIFSNIDSIIRWANSPSNKVAKPIQFIPYSINNNIKDALRLYCGFESIDINYFLRNDKILRFVCDIEARIEGLKQYIIKIDSVIKERKLNQNILVVRWIKSQYIYSCLGVELDKIKKESIYLDKGYLSTSIFVYYIGEYDTIPRDISKYTLLLIKVPKGTNAVYVEGHISDREEYELLLHRGCYLKIERIYNVLFRPFIIICKIIGST